MNIALKFLFISHFAVNVSFSQFSIKSWSIKTGADLSKGYYSIEQMKPYLSDASFINNDFSSYYVDSSVTRSFDPPVQMEFDLVFAKKEISKWVDNIQYKVKLGIATHELGYDNRLHETFLPIYNSTLNVVYRDFYGFTFSSVNGYLGFETVYSTQFIGKKERLMIGYGLGAQVGLTELDLYIYHLEGHYKAELDLYDEVYGDYKYFFPALDYSTVNSFESVGKYFNTGIYAIGFIEKSYFKRRNFLMGFQSTLGAAGIFKKSVNPIVYFYPSLSMTFKFLLGQFKEEKV